jgi:hypothetical protein
VGGRVQEPPGEVQEAERGGVEAGFSRRSRFEAADDIALFMQAIAVKPWGAAPASRGWAKVVVALRGKGFHRTRLRVRARKDSGNW